MQRELQALLAALGVGAGQADLVLPFPQAVDGRAETAAAGGPFDQRLGADDVVLVERPPAAARLPGLERRVEDPRRTPTPTPGATETRPCRARASRAGGVGEVAGVADQRSARNSVVRRRPGLARSARSRSRRRTIGPGRPGPRSARRRGLGVDQQRPDVLLELLHRQDAVERRAARPPETGSSSSPPRPPPMPRRSVSRSTPARGGAGSSGGRQARAIRGSAPARANLLVRRVAVSDLATNVTRRGRVSGMNIPVAAC